MRPLAPFVYPDFTQEFVGVGSRQPCGAEGGYNLVDAVPEAPVRPPSEEPFDRVRAVALSNLMQIQFVPAVAAFPLRCCQIWTLEIMIVPCPGNAAEEEESYGIDAS